MKEKFLEFLDHSQSRNRNSLSYFGELFSFDSLYMHSLVKKIRPKKVLKKEVVSYQVPDVGPVVVPEIQKGPEVKSMVISIPLEKSEQSGLRKRGNILSQFEQTSGEQHKKIFIVGHGSSSEFETSEDLYGGKSGELLKKMIGAMNATFDSSVYSVMLTDSETTYSLGPNEDFLNKYLEDLLCEIYLAKPLFVLGLGALSSHLLLGRRERLSKVHGEIFSYKIEIPNQDSFTFNWMPLFHPEFLLINPNMKKAAWEDLKKLMEYVEKTN